MSNRSVSILGCGWLGLPLGKYLVGKGFGIKGSVTNREKFTLLQEAGIKPFEVKISDSGIVSGDLAGFLDADILIINFPPSRREDIVAYHTAQFGHLIPEIISSRVRHVLFISSTSVYPDLNREVTETECADPAKGSGSALKQVEQMLINEPAFSTTIVRFAGLMGYDRKPGRFLAGKKEVENGDAPVNLIHRDDCVEIIYQIIAQEVWGDIFNACADRHPVRREFYTLAAGKIGLEPPAFATDGPVSFKIINSDKIKRRLGYAFKHPDPVEALNF